MPPAIGGPRGQDLSKSTVARLAIGGLFVGSLLIVAAISYDNLGIALIGDFSTKSNPRGDKAQAKPTPAQMRALVLLCRRLRERYNIPLSRIIRHSDVSRTHCPGDRFPFDEFLKQIG